MKKIKPSDGYSHQNGDLVQIIGRIDGAIHNSTDLGGRWIVPICDADAETSNHSLASLAVNRNPFDNPHLPSGIKEPLPAIIALFEEDIYRPLFRRGGMFLAEAVVGFVDGVPWYNVFQLLLFEPYLPVGVRQIIREPTCQRQIMLTTRGVREPSKSNDNFGMGAMIVGQLVHAFFQSIVSSSERDILAQKFKDEPEPFLVQYLPREIALRIALGIISKQSLINDDVLHKAKTHVRNLLQSKRIQELIGTDTWMSEVPVSTSAIDGIVDLHTGRKIIELKATIKELKKHREQVELYLVGEMIKHGVNEVRNNHSGYLVYSSSNIMEDSQRVVQVNDPIKMLNRFLTARHRYLLASGHFSLPNITSTIEECADCLFFNQKHEFCGSAACHFYCQTDRDWDCAECLHLSVCDQSQKYHNYKVLDEANNIRSALLKEIQIYRQELNDQGTADIWEEKFILLEIKSGGQFVLKPSFPAAVDPPPCGARVSIWFDSNFPPLIGEVVQNGLNDDLWIISAYGTSTFLKIGTICRVIEQRGRLRNLFNLLSCIDQLQRSKARLPSEGIAFAGGRVVSGKLDYFEDLKAALKAQASDVFCQSYNLRQSWNFLKELLECTSGRNLIVAERLDFVEKFPDVISISAGDVQDVLNGCEKIKSAVRKLKDYLESAHSWVVSPDFVFSDFLEYLPNKGKEFFDQLIIYEVATCSPLEYYLARNYGKRCICIGDANTVGRLMHTPLSASMGLGNNIMNRVIASGFPKGDSTFPALVKVEEQSTLPLLMPALSKCRMTTIERPKENGEIIFHSHENVSEMSKSESLFDEFIVDVPNEPPRKIQLRTNNTSKDEITRDINTIRFDMSINIGEQLNSSLAGRSYIAVTTPEPLAHDFDQRLPDGKWAIQVLREETSLKRFFNEGEARIVASLVKEFLKNGVKQKNIGIFSPFPKQLQEISTLLSDHASGINFRTPYNIRNESWGTIVISCVLESLFDAAPEIVDPKLFYSMMRPGISRVIIVGHKQFIANHPFLRNLEHKKKN